MVQLDSLFINRQLGKERLDCQYQLRSPCFFHVQNLCNLKVQETGDVLWANPKRSSTQYCCPVRMQYIKENQQVVQVKYDFFLLTELIPTTIDSFPVKHKFECTMIDRKVSSFLSQLINSHQVCSVSGLNPKNMKNFENAFKKSRI